MVKTQYSLVIQKISWNPHSTKNKKWSFSLMISSLNVTKSGRNCGFGHIEEILLNGNLHFLCSASDPIMVSSWVQNSVCMRKRQTERFNLCCSTTEEPKSSPTGHWIKGGVHSGKEQTRKKLGKQDRCQTCN